MIRVDQMSLLVPTADAYKSAGFAIEMTIVGTTATKSHAHQPHVSQTRSLPVPRIIVSRPSGGVMGNQIVLMEMMSE